MSWFVRPVVPVVVTAATVLALAGASRPAAGQHAFAEAGTRYDPRVPTPRAVLGYELGERFTPKRLIDRYIERVAAATRRVQVDTVARSFEGR